MEIQSFENVNTAIDDSTKHTIRLTLGGAENKTSAIYLRGTA